LLKRCSKSSRVFSVLPHLRNIVHAKVPLDKLTNKLCLTLPFQWALSAFTAQKGFTNARQIMNRTDYDRIPFADMNLLILRSLL
jgi:hypothetical protein